MTPKRKPARLWAVWSPTKGYYLKSSENGLYRQRNAARLCSHWAKVLDTPWQSPDWTVVPVRLVKLTRTRRSK